MLFRQQMDALEKRGNEVFAFNSTHYNDPIPNKFVSIMDEKVHHVECWNNIDRMLFFPRQWKTEKQLLNRFSIQDFDLIHSHLLLTTGYSALRLKRRYKTPFVVSVRNTDINGFMKVPGFKYLARMILKEASGVLFLSNSLKKLLYDNYLTKEQIEMVENKSEVIGNPLERFWEFNTVSGRNERVDKDKVRVLLVAKIKPVKNITTAAAAIEELCKRGYKAELTVVGENQDQEEYERIKKYDHTTILPFKTKEELINIYREHDVFLLPSLEETFGRSYVEAMSQGLPVLYTKGQGFDNYYPDGVVGFSIPSDNPKVIADKLENVFKNYSTISNNAVIYCKDFYEDNIIDRLEVFYERALKKNSMD